MTNELGRLDQLRARKAARVADRAAFAELRAYGLRARHAAKLARLSSRPENENPEEHENPVPPEETQETEVA